MCGTVVRRATYGPFSFRHHKEPSKRSNTTVIGNTSGASKSIYLNNYTHGHLLHMPLCITFSSFSRTFHWIYVKKIFFICILFASPAVRKIVKKIVRKIEQLNVYVSWTSRIELAKSPQKLKLLFFLSVTLELIFSLGFWPLL